MFKLSVSSKNTYTACQRKFWHQYINKTMNDPDYITPNYFNFGRAFEECLELFQYDYKQMLMHIIKDICAKNSLTSDQDIGKIAAMLRHYFAKWPKTEVIGQQIWVDNDYFRGRIDGLIKQNDYYYILENKTTSEILPSLQLSLFSDPQLCLYASSTYQIAKAASIDYQSIKGVIYRAVEKPSQRIKVAQKTKETMLEYTARCVCGTFEFCADIKQLKIASSLTEFICLYEEITTKTNEEEFHKNTRNCVEFGKNSCAFYSKCHGALFTNMNQEDDSNIDF